MLRSGPVFSSARQRRFWWAAILVLVLGGASVAGTIWTLTSTDSGRAWVLSQITSRTAGLFGNRGHLQIGILRQLNSRGIVAEDVAIVDTSGVSVLHAERVAVTLSWSALFRKAIHLGQVTVDGLVLQLEQTAPERPWNIAYIVAGDTAQTVSSTAPGFGDDVRIDSLLVLEATITTIAPWEPHPVFKGSARDSVIAIRDSLHNLIHVSNDRFLERRQIDIGRLRARDAVVMDPERRPSSLRLDSVSVAISDPAVTVTQAQGELSWTSDSLRFSISHAALTSSEGNAIGVISWGEPGPLRYDVNARADAGLSDLLWVWDALPATGRGKADVRMRTLENPDDVEFALTNLDVESGVSRIAGAVSITMQPADLILHHADLRFSPLHTDLLRRISYDALPKEIEGRITGRLLAVSGGPLTSLSIDKLEASFFDESQKLRGQAKSGVNQPVSHIALGGTVGIGANPYARDVSVTDLRLDLRSLTPFMDSVTAPDGVVVGTAKLRQANLTSIDLPAFAIKWTDAANNVSAARGQLALKLKSHTSGGSAGSAATDSSPGIDNVHAKLILESLSMEALARIDSTVPLSSRIAGVVDADGSIEAMNWRADLLVLLPNESGLVFDGDSIALANRTLSLSGTAGIERQQWQAQARGSVSNLDLQRWVGKRTVPVTNLNGDFEARANGSVAANPLHGDTASAPSEPPTGEALFHISQTGGLRQPAFQTSGRVQLDQSRLRIESGIFEMGGVKVEANGRLARDSMQTDTLEVSLNADSLDAVRGELERLAGAIASLDSTLAESLRRVAADTLKGEITASGYITGNLSDIEANAALGGREVQVGGLSAGRIFGSFRADQVLTRPVFDGAVTVDEVDGIGALKIHSATARLGPASADSGLLTLDVGTESDAQLMVRGAYNRKQGRTSVSLDSIRLSYADVLWSTDAPAVLVADSSTLELLPVKLTSSAGGSLSMAAAVPAQGGVSGLLTVDRFPFGEVATLLVGAEPVAGSVTGRAELSGSREAPLLSWRLSGDSLGINGYRFPPITTDGSYRDQLLQGQVVLVDSAGGSLIGRAVVPIDLRLMEVSKRRLADSLQGTITASSLRLDALPLHVDGVSKITGELRGELAFDGTLERIQARGTMTLAGAGAVIDELGISPADGLVVLRADGDSVHLESLRLRSGRSRGDTLVAHGVVRIPANGPSTLDVSIKANSFEMARKADGTDLIVGGDLKVSGALERPLISGRLRVPTANIVVDPLGERVALDLTSESSRALLGLDEVPVAESAAATLSGLGAVVRVENARIDLGQDVWVQTPEAKVKLGGGLNIAISGEHLVLDGEITAERGQYRLELGPVYRGFSIDSGSVRFFPTPAIAPALDINATNTVRVAGGGDVPIKLHIGGGYNQPTLTLSSTDPLYSSAPESEIISLLIFGAPTFALDGQSQSTVRAVTGLLLPTVGGAVEGALQRILPGDFNTVQVSTGSNESLTSLAPSSLFDNLNLSISAGKQIGDRTYLRLNTGVCRGTGQASMQGAQLWAGIAVEYRIARGWLAQLGVDPGSAPCTRVGGTELPRMQFGFDLFRDWIF